MKLLTYALRCMTAESGIMKLTPVTGSATEDKGIQETINTPVVDPLINLTLMLALLPRLLTLLPALACAMLQDQRENLLHPTTLAPRHMQAHQSSLLATP